MRPMTPDGLPMIGAMPGLTNGYVATGHAMLGITLAPVTALAMAGLITTGTSSYEIGALDPVRFR